MQKEFSERQSDRLEVGLFGEKHTPQTEYGPLQRVSAAVAKCGVVSFYGLDNFIDLMCGRIIPTILEKG